MDTTKIRELMAQRRELRAEAKRVQKQIREAKNKRSRLLMKARRLSADDLCILYHEKVEKVNPEKAEKVNHKKVEKVNRKKVKINPPAAEPPAAEPPAAEPPAAEPPAVEPPGTEPPVAEPPAAEPSAG
jgi:hypothetical protein